MGIIFASVPFQGCDPDDDDDCDTCIVAYKPNIYIYPEKNINLDINVSFPVGGEIITSIPKIGSGWSVNVDTNGIIDKTYGYLFYESKQPDVWQKSEGYTVEKEDVDRFFRENLAEYGFEGREVDDFIEYWVPRLSSFKFYNIYPQTNNEIDKVISLKFSVQPANIGRLFYLIEGHDEEQEHPKAPEIKSFSRVGFHVMEWGVLMK